MPPTSLIFRQPACNIFSAKRVSNNSSPKKSVLCPRFRKGSSSGGYRLYPNKIQSKRMSHLAKPSAFRRGSDGEDRFHALEQESLFEGSSEISPEFVAGGTEVAINRLSKWLVSGLFGSALLLRHDGEALWAVIGAVTNAILSVVLKRIFNQERPVVTLKSDPGMPSSHAQSISFIAIFAVFSILEFFGSNGVTLFTSGLILACASYFTWLRVALNYHTISQVVVGGIVGSAFSVFWSIIWKSVVSEAFASSMWAQIGVFLGAAAFGLGFAVYVVRSWLSDDR